MPHDERGPPAAVAHLRRDAGQIFGLLLEGVRRRLRHDAQKNLRNKTSLRQPGKIDLLVFFNREIFVFVLLVRSSFLIHFLMLLFEDWVHLPHMLLRQYITTLACANSTPKWSYKYTLTEIFCRGLGFEPVTFRLLLYCLGVTPPYRDLHISLQTIFLPLVTSTLEDLAEVLLFLLPLTKLP